MYSLKIGRIKYFDGHIAGSLIIPG